MTTEGKDATLRAIWDVAGQIDKLEADLRAARELRKKLIITGGRSCTVAELATAADVPESTINTMLKVLGR